MLVGVAGVGSFIAERQPQGQLIEVRNIAEEIRARGHEYMAHVVQNVAVKATRKTAPLLGVAPGTKLFHSIIVHKEAGTPIQVEDRLVLADAVPEDGTIDFTQITPDEYLTRMAPLERVQHQVRAIMPDDYTRGLLAMGPDDPCLLMLRQTWSRSRITSYLRLFHPGSRFELSATFEP